MPCPTLHSLDPWTSCNRTCCAVGDGMPLSVTSPLEQESFTCTFQFLFFFFLSFINLFNKYLSQILSWELGKWQRIRPMWYLLTWGIAKNSILPACHSCDSLADPSQVCFLGRRLTWLLTVGSDGHCACCWAAGWGWGSFHSRGLPRESPLLVYPGCRLESKYPGTV